MCIYEASFGLDQENIIRPKNDYLGSEVIRRLGGSDGASRAQNRAIPESELITPNASEVILFGLDPESDIWTLVGIFERETPK